MKEIIFILLMTTHRGGAVVVDSYPSEQYCQAAIAEGKENWTGAGFYAINFTCVPAGMKNQ